MIKDHQLAELVNLVTANLKASISDLPESTREIISRSVNDWNDNREANSVYATVVCDPECTYIDEICETKKVAYERIRLKLFAGKVAFNECKEAEPETMRDIEHIPTNYKVEKIEVLK